ncbi:ATP-binding cassette domain-containing protein [Acidianus sulfidivorans JP7]|uniref:Molybdate/tungstate import ATP-binding protein WtpC n=1 Tax=Acidianus sulfidivorans JP7 TaxID=619593 RepID=A0A2U9INV3_9CREN|nr:ATP-binding cassette domain-containing protein [Acidianus sulfidivorans]AWR97693.1 ATP-binding cassette domain-containing protein [Acidianus sulfidivorans JP7]
MIEALTYKKLGEFNLNAEIKEEGIICITGKNGSGKTTFLRAVSGFIKLDKGYIKINNYDITNLPPEKRDIVLVNQESYIPNFKVNSHILWGAKLKKIKIEEEEIKEAKELLEINFDGKVGKLSLGQKEKVALLTAVFSKPKFILIDEAFANINNKKEIMQNFFDLTKKYKIEIIFTTQDEKDAELANSYLVMENGKLIKIV